MVLVQASAVVVAMRCISAVPTEIPPSNWPGQVQWCKQHCVTALAGVCFVGIAY